MRTIRLKPFLFRILLCPDDFPNLKHPPGAVLDILEILVEFLLIMKYEDLFTTAKVMMNEKTGESEVFMYVIDTEFEKLCTIVTK